MPEYGMAAGKRWERGWDSSVDLVQLEKAAKNSRIFQTITADLLPKNVTRGAKLLDNGWQLLFVYYVYKIKHLLYPERVHEQTKEDRVLTSILT